MKCNVCRREKIDKKWILTNYCSIKCWHADTCRGNRFVAGTLKEKKRGLKFKAIYGKTKKS